MNSLALKPWISHLRFCISRKTVFALSIKYSFQFKDFKLKQGV